MPSGSAETEHSKVIPLLAAWHSHNYCKQLTSPSRGGGCRVFTSSACHQWMDSLTIEMTPVKILLTGMLTLNYATPLLNMESLRAVTWPLLFPSFPAQQSVWLLLLVFYHQPPWYICSYITRLVIPKVLCKLLWLFVMDIREFVNHPCHFLAREEISRRMFGRNDTV